MSGPKTVEYTLLDALADSWAAYEAEQQQRAAERARAAAEAEAERQEALRRREEERRAKEAARQRAERAQMLLVEARAVEQRLERAQALVAAARSAHPQAAIDIAVTLPTLANPTDPEAVERYLGALRDTVNEVETRLAQATQRAAADQGLRDLMGAIGATVATSPRTAADILDVYAAQLRARHAPAAASVTDRRATAERILGRLAGEAATEVPADLEALMRELIEAPTQARADLVALELRARVQRLNDERETRRKAEKENRKREIAAEIVADALADLGYDVETIQHTLFVEGGVAHFQRAEWGDYFVRLRVDPATRAINLNMIRTAESAAPAEGSQRRRDEEMENAWCGELPRLLEELKARGIDARRLRALDPGALPVQIVKPQAVSEQLRARRAKPQAAAAPQAMARPIK